MHVESEERDVRQPVGELGEASCVVEWNAELVAALSGADILVRRVDRDLRIHADRHRRTYTSAARNLVDEEKLALRFDVDEQDAGIERLLQLAFGLSHSAEDDVARFEAGEHRTIELAPGDDIGAGPEA